MCVYLFVVLQGEFLMSKSIVIGITVMMLNASVLVGTPSVARGDGILVAGKAFNDADCLKYLGRPIRSYGYQPVQIIIKNDSDKALIFSPDQVSLPCARVENIFEQAHTSTVGRAVGYGAAAVLTCGLFVIPAVVDGIKSSNANDALDSDYFAKAAKRTIIAPSTKMNTIIFVPSGSYTDSIKITLLEEETNQAHKMSVKMY